MWLLIRIVSGIRRLYWFLFRPETTGVKCLIECEGEYLLIKHSYGSRMKNWNLPGGGLKKNESVVNAVKREALEELDIKLTEVTEIKKYTSSAEYKVDTIHCFYSKVGKKDFKINRSEILEAKWFPKDNLPENISRSIKESLSYIPS